MAGRRARSRRGLAMGVLLLVALVVAVDLLRSDSVILGLLRDMSGDPGTPLERLLDRVRP